MGVSHWISTTCATYHSLLFLLHRVLDGLLVDLAKGSSIYSNHVGLNLQEKKILFGALGYILVLIPDHPPISRVLFLN